LREIRLLAPGVRHAHIHSVPGTDRLSAADVWTIAFRPSGSAVEPPGNVRCLHGDNKDASRFGHADRVDPPNKVVAFARGEIVGSSDAALDSAGQVRGKLFGGVRRHADVLLPRLRQAVAYQGDFGWQKGEMSSLRSRRGGAEGRWVGGTGVSAGLSGQLGRHADGGSGLGPKRNLESRCALRHADAGDAAAERQGTPAVFLLGAAAEAG